MGRTRAGEPETIAENGSLRLSWAAAGYKAHHFFCGNADNHQDACEVACSGPEPVVP